jgi:hypothetical protein
VNNYASMLQNIMNNLKHQQMNKFILKITFRSPWLISGGGNCSIAGGVQFDLMGRKVGTPW